MATIPIVTGKPITEFGQLMTLLNNPSAIYTIARDDSTGTDYHVSFATVLNGVTQNVIARLTPSSAGEWNVPPNASYLANQSVHFTDPNFTNSGVYLAPTAIAAGIAPPAAPWVLLSLDGKDGKSSIVTITATHPNIPAVGASATYSADSNAGLNVGQYVTFGTGVLTVASLTGATGFSLANVSAVENTPVAVGAKLVPAGKPGTNGTNGISAITMTTGTNPVIPAIGSPATYNFVDASGLITQQYYGFAGIAGTLLVTAKTATSATLQNVDATVGATVSSGTIIAPVGKAGAGGSGGGGIGLVRTFSSSQIPPPSAGRIRLNGDPNTATQIYISETDISSVDQTEFLQKIKVGNIIQVTKTTTGKYAAYLLSSIVDNGAYWTLGVTYKFGTAVANDFTTELLFQWLPDQSASGAASGLQYKYQGATGTAAAGEIRGDLAAGGAIAIHPTDDQGNVQSTLLARLKAGAIFRLQVDAANWAQFTVTTDYASGSVTVGAGMVEGAIAAGVIVFLSILSDAAIPGPPGSGSTVRIREVDNAPNDLVTEIVVPNGSLAIAGGVATLNFSTGAGEGRVAVTADRTYYVRAGGQRTGDVLTETDATNNTDLDAFSTINGALSALKKLDFRGFTPTVFIGDGVFQESVPLPALLGADKANLIGNGIAACTILYETSGGNGFILSAIGISTVWSISNLKISSTANNKIGIQCSNASCNLANMHLDTSWIDTLAGALGSISISENLTISRNKLVEWYANATGNITVAGATITVSGALNFSSAGMFCADGNPVITFASNTITGTATGVKYRANYGGKILSTTAESSLLGNQAGTQNNGNFYQI